MSAKSIAAAASALGKLAKGKTSARKATSSAANGKLGGRPRLARSCELCGADTTQDSGRCTNGRCGSCHQLHCTPGGNDAPGHGRGAK